MTDSSDSGDSGDFAPGPPVTEVRLSPELSAVWEADHHFRGRLRHGIRVLSEILGDTVCLCDSTGRPLAQSWT